MIHDFNQKLEYSLGQREIFDISILKRIHQWADVVKTTKDVDKTGIDYIATLKDGATINIDAKTREKGASKWWTYGEPELTVETWSSLPTDTYEGKIGWTFNEGTNVDYILYTFDKSDCDKFYYIPFQLLKNAAYKYYHEWKSKYGIKKQPNIGWDSRAIFVPASVLITAVNEQMTGTAYE